MIGMMNTPVENPVEFYAGRRYLLTVDRSVVPEDQAQIQLAPVQKKLSYTEEGRRLVDGEPETSETPSQMWAKLMLKVSCNKAIEEGLARAGRKNHGTRLIRRIISRGNTSIRSMLNSSRSSNSNRTEKAENAAVAKGEAATAGGGEQMAAIAADHTTAQGKMR